MEDSKIKIKSTKSFKKGKILKLALGANKNTEKRYYKVLSCRKCSYKLSFPMYSLTLCEVTKEE